MKDFASLSLFDRPKMIRETAPIMATPRVEFVAKSTKKSPRPYQAEMRDKAVGQFRSGVRSTIAVLPTGTGKTYAASLVIADMNVRTLWLNERRNLVKQMRGELSDHLGRYVYVEQGQVKAPVDAWVVVGSLQSMVQDNRLSSFSRGHFGLIVTDEAHHSTAPGYRKVFYYFSKALLLGLSATPSRQDGVSMGLVYEAIAADYAMGEAIDDGWLVRPEWVFGSSINLSGIKKSTKDFTDDQLAENMDARVLRGMRDEILEHAGNLRGPVYLPRVDVVHAFAILLNNARPGCAVAVDGRDMDPDEKDAIIAAHRRGDFPYLINDSVVVEGHDDATINFIGAGRPTKSISRATQEIGRGTRPDPAARIDAYATSDERISAILSSAKPSFRVLDFVGNAGKHDLASPIDIMAGRLDDEETKQAAKKVLKERGGDAHDALAIARKMRAREREEEAKRIERVESAKWNWKTIDPFSAFGMSGPTDVATALNMASSGQRNMLRRFNVDIPAIITAPDAQRLIRACMVRKKRGLADYGLVRLLSRHGIPAQQMYQGTAERHRDAIVRNRGWTPEQAVIDEINAVGRRPGEDIY